MPWLPRNFIRGCYGQQKERPPSKKAGGTVASQAQRQQERQVPEVQKIISKTRPVCKAPVIVEPVLQTVSGARKPQNRCSSVSDR